VGPDISDQDLGFVLPDEVGNNVLEGHDDGVGAKGAELRCPIDESVVDREHLETVEETLRGVEVSEDSLLVRILRALQVLLANVSQIRDEIEDGRIAGDSAFLSKASSILSVGNEISKDEDDGEDRTYDLGTTELISLGGCCQDPCGKWSKHSLFGEPKEADPKHKKSSEESGEVNAPPAAAATDGVESPEDDRHGKKAVELVEGAQDRAASGGKNDEGDTKQNSSDKTADSSCLHLGVCNHPSQEGALGSNPSTEIDCYDHHAHAHEQDSDGEFRGQKVAVCGLAEIGLHAEPDDDAEH